MSKKQQKNEWRAPRVHRLKIWPSFFKEVKEERKPWELRRMDRDYRVDDALVLAEWDPETESFTGQTVIREISHVFTGGRFGLARGFCILSFKPEKGVEIPIPNYHLNLKS